MFSRVAMRAAAVGGVAAFGVAATAQTASAADQDWDQCRKDIAALLDQDDWDDGSLGPVFVRLAWHSSGSYCAKTGTGGSNGATMRFAPEINHGGNAGLDKAQKWLESIKRKHPNISYADIWILAGIVAIEEMAGPKINFTPGRTDSADATTPGDDAPTPDGRLPDGDKGAQHLRDIFYRQGFNDQEIVALSGAHALGRCHTDRSGFDGPWTRAPTTFSNEYFRVLYEEEWVKRKWDGPPQYENKDGKDLMMLETDMCLKSDPEFSKWAKAYKDDGELFERHFAAAAEKLFHNGFRKPSWKRYLFGEKYV